MRCNGDNGEDEQYSKDNHGKEYRKKDDLNGLAIAELLKFPDTEEKEDEGPDGCKHADKGYPSQQQARGHAVEYCVECLHKPITPTQQVHPQVCL
jgi:hypothetical protein